MASPWIRTAAEMSVTSFRVTLVKDCAGRTEGVAWEARHAITVALPESEVMLATCTRVASADRPGWRGLVFTVGRARLGDFTYASEGAVRSRIKRLVKERLASFRASAACGELVLKATEKLRADGWRLEGK